MNKKLILVAILLCSAFLLGSIRIQNPFFENEHLKVEFGIAKTYISGYGYADVFSALIQNKTDRVIKIIWDETSITDNWGWGARVIHSGVKFIHSDLPQVPTIIPPKSVVKDIMIPVTHIKYSNGWVIYSVSGDVPERYFLITYKIDETRYHLSGKLVLYESLEQEQPQMSTNELVLAIIGGIIGFLLVWYLLTQ